MDGGPYVAVPSYPRRSDVHGVYVSISRRYSWYGLNHHHPREAASGGKIDEKTSDIAFGGLGVDVFVDATVFRFPYLLLLHIFNRVGT